jgi:hypothetical protein
MAMRLLLLLQEVLGAERSSRPDQRAAARPAEVEHRTGR